MYSDPKHHLSNQPATFKFFMSSFLDTGQKHIPYTMGPEIKTWNVKKSFTYLKAWPNFQKGPLTQDRPPASLIDAQAAILCFTHFWDGWWQAAAHRVICFKTTQIHVCLQSAGQQTAIERRNIPTTALHSHANSQLSKINSKIGIIVVFHFFACMDLFWQKITKACEY